MITYDSKGNAIGFTGRDVNVFMAAALRSGLGLMEIGIRPHRHWTSLRVALDQATQYTGHKYSGKKDIPRARADLDIFIQVRKALAQ